MANMMPFMIMTELEAARLRDVTQGQLNRLDPRLIVGGPKAGKYALPERLKYAEEFRENLDAFLMLEVVTLDTDLAWPVPPEDQRRINETN